MPILRTENLSERFGSGSAIVTALDNVSFSIEPGEFVAVMGPSGCGKSTLLHLLGGLDRPTSGRVLLEGRGALHAERHRPLPPPAPQDRVRLPVLQPDSRPLGRRERRPAADARRPPEGGGAQQRVAIARALIAEPAILLADEPTGNLDSRAADDLLQLLWRSADEWGRTVVMVTHDARMTAYADRIVFMREGTVADDAPLGPRTTVDEIAERASARR